MTLQRVKNHRETHSNPDTPIMFFVASIVLVMLGLLWILGMSKSRHVRLGTVVCTGLFLVGTLVYVLLPNLQFGLANAEPVEQGHVVATYDLVQPGQAVPTPACSVGEKATIRLFPAKVALRSGGGGWSVQPRESDWLIVFSPKGDDAPPLFTPLAAITRNENPVISAQTMCSSQAKRV